MKVKSVSQNLSELSGFDLNLLTVFSLIYSTGSISAASEVLNISPSAVSQSLKKLRHHFNDELFNRTGHSIKPTIYANELFQLSEECLGKIATFLPTQGTKERRNLVIYTGVTLSQIVIPEIAIEILNSEDEFNIIHNEGDASEPKVREVLNLRQADIAMSASKIQNNIINSVKLHRMKFILVTSMANKENYNTPEKISNANFVGLNAFGELYQYHNHNVSKKYNLKVRRLITPSLTTLLMVLASGKCLGIVPEIIFKKNREKYNLVKIENVMKLPSIDIYMNYRQELTKNEHTGKFIKRISEFFSDKI